MTKRTLIALALVFGVTGAANAQSSASAGATVSATVVSAIGISATTGTINLGVVSPGDGTVTVSPSAGGANAAEFAVTGAASQAFTVSYTMQGQSGAADVVDDGAGHSMAFTPAVTAGATQATSTAVSNGGSTALDATGAQTLWAGGDLVVGGSQFSGTYSGTLTLTVAY